jgi:hypothetical protein
METVAAVIAALIFGTVTLPIAIFTGNSQPYCETLLGGTYTKGQPDVCPDGDWARVVGLAKTKLPTPKG